MKHIHNKTGVKYDVSRLIDFDGKTHDMCVILNGMKKETSRGILL